MTAEASAPDNWFIVDAPINTSDLDAFGHADIADNLHRMVTEPGAHRRMIGLFGDFGVGKSTIIELLREKLAGHKKLRVIRMSAERHEPVGFHRAAVYGFAEALVDTGEVTAKQAEEILEPLRSAQTLTTSDAALSPVGRLLTSIREKLNLKGRTFVLLVLGALVVAALLLGGMAWAVGAEVWENIQKFAIPIITGTAFFAPLVWLGAQIRGDEFSLTALLTPGTNTTQRPKVEAADEQERAFAALVTRATHTLVVAVDDIDRLSKEQILDALNAIRSFQLTCKRERRPIFIVSISEDIIRDALAKEDGLEEREQAQDFLNRLFTLRQEVPTHETLDLRDYARDVLQSQAPALAAKLGTRTDDVINMLIHDDVADPRHVVRLINAFSSDYRLALARETREGRRALRADAVTAHPDVLARAVVLRTDYANFFKAALADLEIVQIASRASSTALDQDSIDQLGKFADRATHRSLYKYLARTAGWVPADVDLFPFLYLGQDRISLALGNAQARELRSALANNLVVDLASLVEAAEERGAEAVALFRERLVSVLRELADQELGNAAAAVLQVAATSPALQDPDVARAVAVSLADRPDSGLDVGGALALAAAAQLNDARALLEVAKSDAGPDDEAILWDARAQLTKTFGEQGFTEWGLSQIRKATTWESLARWNRDDLGDTFAVALIKQVLDVASTVAEANSADEADLANVQAIVAQITEPVPVPNPDSLVGAMGIGADTYESAIAHECARALTFSDEQLVELLQASRSSQTGLGEDEQPLVEVQDGVAALTVLMSAQNAGIGYWKVKDPHSVASVGSSLIAEWVDAGTFPASKAVPVVHAMCTQGAKTHAPLVKSLMGAWVSDPAGADTDEVDFFDSVRTMIADVPKMENEAKEEVREAWVTALGEDVSRAFVAPLAPHILTADTPAKWADDALTELLSQFQYGIDFTGDATDAASLVMATGRVSEDSEEALLEAFTLVLNRGGVYRARALTSIARLQWSEDVNTQVVEAVVDYASEIPDAEYWALFDVFTARGLTDSDFVTRVDLHLDDDEPTTEMETRAEPLAALLTLEHATAVALAATSTAAFKVVAERTRHVARDADETVATLLRQIASFSASMTLRTTFAQALAAADGSDYATAVRQILTDTLDVGLPMGERMWSFATVPLTNADRTSIWETVKDELSASTREALSAAVVLYATNADKAFDALVAKGIKDIMFYWITEEPNPQVTAAIATAIRASKKSRVAVNEPVSKKWRRPERKAAAAAGSNALS